MRTHSHSHTPDNQKGLDRLLRYTRWVMGLAGMAPQRSQGSHWTAACLAALLFAVSTFASAATISTFGGNPIPNGAATGVAAGANGVATNAAGDIYQADATNHAIRKIDHTTGISTVIAGMGVNGSTGDGGAATSAKLNGPKGVALDSTGNLYIADTNNHRIRKVDTSGVITTIAGTGIAGNLGDGSAATSARVNFPQSLTVDSTGNIYIADTSSHKIRKIDTSGIITTVAGTGTPGNIGDGAAATDARLSSPRGVVLDSSGNMYIADSSNSRIRKVDTSGIITLYTGSVAGFLGDGGAATSARLSVPQGIAIDSTGNIYVADTNNHRVRIIDTSGIINTFAGSSASAGFGGDGGAATSALLSSPTAVNMDSTGNLYIGDTSNFRMRKVDTSLNISTVAGNGTTNFSGDGGPATNAQFGSPQGVAVDSAGNVYMADSSHHRIRKIDTSGNISTYAGIGTGGYNGDGIAATTAQINTPLGIAIDSSGNLYIADGNNARIRKIDTSGIISTVAGTGTPGFSGDGSAATSAQINGMFGVGVDSAGNIYIGDTGNNRIRKVDTSGIISTIAGNGSAGYSGDGGAATSAMISTPMQVTGSSTGAVYLIDYGNSTVRKVDSGIITSYAGTGVSGYTGDGGAASSARLNTPRSLYIASDGTLYIADTSNSVVRKVDTSGIITTVAGTSAGFSGDGGDALLAQINNPQGIAVSSGGDIYIGDTSNKRLRKVSVSGATVPGAPTAATAATAATATAGDTAATVTFTAPASDGGSAITGYTVTSNPGGLTGTGSSSPITVTGLSNGTSYTFTVTATNSVGTGAASSASNSVTPKANQTITFADPGDQNFGTTPTLTATSDSSLTVSFTSSTTGVCTITSGGALTFITPGTCTINTDQAGSSTYNAASTVSRSFTVNAVVPGAPTIGTATAGDTQATVTFSAPGSDGGASISGYTVTASPGGATGTGASSPITVTGLSNGTSYTFTVTATNSVGTGAASSASNSVTPKANQTITFANPGTQNFGTTPTLTASSDSTLTVSFTSSTTGVCTITSGGALTFVTPGTCTINADQAGSTTYNAAPTVSRSFTVNAVVPGAPTIGTATAGDGQASVSFTAPTSNGGSTITGYTVTSSPDNITATGLGSPIGVNGLNNGTSYTFTVTATNSVGTGSASAASNSVTPKANQTITFADPGDQNFGTTPTLTATSNSTLTVSFTSSTTGVCTITSGGALTFVTPGTCTINADQTGSSTYNAASTVSQSFTVSAVVPGAPIIGTATASDTTATVTFSAPAFNGGAAITGYTVMSNPSDGTDNNAGSTGLSHSVTGLSNGTSYTFTVTATNSAGTGSASAASNSVTPKANQTITFANPGTQNFGTTPTLTASSDSTLTVSFTSSTTGVCTITSGDALTFVTPGTCTINADQAGSTTYNAASTVSQSFTVSAVVPGAPTITEITAGNAQLSVAFTAGGDGGAVLSNYEYSSNGGTDWVAMSPATMSSPLVLTTASTTGTPALVNGTSYSVKIRALNSAGAGATSNGLSATPAAVPSVTTGSATSITKNSVTLAASVNANGATTSALTIRYATVQATIDTGGGTAATISPINATGSSTTSISANVTGLTPNTTYYYRASATNVQGTTVGSTLSFTTLPISDLAIANVHTGNYMLGIAGGAYTLTVTKTGDATDGSTISVIDTLPTGLSARSLDGTGWACTLGTLTCTRSDSLSSYSPITLIVDVADTAPAFGTDEVVNSATVSGGGDVTVNNNTASDTAIVSLFIDDFDGP